MNFLAPGFLWLMALAAPVVLLYFFRQKQQDRVVPTNFLWAQALQDIRTAAVLRREQSVQSLYGAVVGHVFQSL